MIVGLAAASPGCGSGSGSPQTGLGGGLMGSGGSTGSGGNAGGQGGACPDHSQPTDLPAGINLVNECAYAGTATPGCAAGTFEYDCPDIGFAIAPEAGCVHPTSGTNTTLRWCCTTALCSHFRSRDTRCDCTTVNAHDYNCAPGAAAATTCVANASGDYCCPFTE
jgi:hypothetical protein